MKTTMIALAACGLLTLIATDAQAFGGRRAASARSCSCGPTCVCTPASNCGCNGQTQLVRVGLLRWQRVTVAPTGNYVAPAPQSVQATPTGTFAPIQLTGGCLGGKCFR